MDIARDLDRLKQLGQKGSIPLSDLQGGTITLSNIGNIGGTLLHPVLVEGQVCIGGLGKIQTLPRFDPNDSSYSKIVPSKILDVSFNADHRVIDGATMARFVSTWKHYLERPSVMLAELK